MFDLFALSRHWSYKYVPLGKLLDLKLDRLRQEEDSFTLEQLLIPYMLCCVGLVAALITFLVHEYKVQIFGTCTCTCTVPVYGSTVHEKANDGIFYIYRVGLKWPRLRNYCKLHTKPYADILCRCL